MRTFHFNKYHGAGNDFIMADARGKGYVIPSENDIKWLCDRRTGIGADGLMLLLPSKKYDFKMMYFNSDGREGTMCGNGGRCITSFARKCGIVKEEYDFEAIDGVHYSTFFSEEMISLRMTDVKEVKKMRGGLFINTGSPHFVMLHKSPHKADINNYGKKIRHEKRFGKGGTNVNFISFRKNVITIATFERGVEAETLSCGTGSVASAIAVCEMTGMAEKEYLINAKGGKLMVEFTKTSKGIYRDVYLTGPAKFVYEGKIIF